MSVIRDAMELGYGTNHFMITGEGFPWNDSEEDSPDYSYQDYENYINSLDTKEGWLGRERFLKSDSEEGVGRIDQDEYFQYKQTCSEEEFMAMNHSILKEIVHGFFKSRVIVSTGSSFEAQRVVEFKDDLMREIEKLHSTLRARYEQDTNTNDDDIVF